MSIKTLVLKKKGGGQRVVYVPSAELLAYQKGKLQEVEETFNSLVNHYKLHNVVHGFIRGKNCVTAAREHIGYSTTCVLDIKEFFDSVHRRMLLAIAPSIALDDNLFHPQGFPCQGFATSPLVATIALLPAIATIQEELQRNFKEFALTVYADDIQVSINKEFPDLYVEEALVKTIVATALTSWGFKVNQKKTRVRYSNRGYRRILGINVGDTDVTSSREVKRKIRAATHKKNLKSLRGLQEWAKCSTPKE